MGDGLLWRPREFVQKAGTSAEPSILHEREAECKIAGAHECRLSEHVSELSTSLSASILYCHM